MSRRPVTFFFLLLSFTGCQSATLFSPSNTAAPAVGETTTVSTEDRSDQGDATVDAPPQSIQSIQSVQSPGTIYSTPPTTPSSPIFVTPGKNHTFFSELLVGDPANYPEEDLIVKGFVYTDTPGFPLESIEMTMNLANGSVSTQVSSRGCYSFFVDANSGPRDITAIAKIDEFIFLSLVTIKFSLPPLPLATDINPCSILDGLQRPAPLPHDPGTLAL